MSKAPDGTICIAAHDAPLRARASNYPEPFRSQMAQRQKKPLGDLFGIRNFGVNLTRLLPGGMSSLMHRHDKQDELIFILEGQPTLVTDQGEFELQSGMCAGFPAQGLAHHLINRSASDVVYLEIGDRSPGDSAAYPNDDLEAVLDSTGAWRFLHKDGKPYTE
jgi:uncharacterized cupin superfamily protein